MATRARVQDLHEVLLDESKLGVDWVLCLQWCRYIFDDGTLRYGYRFIWRKPDGKLQAARGQARIPSLDAIKTLMEKATAAGWGDKVDNSPKHDNK